MDMPLNIQSCPRVTETITQFSSITSQNKSLLSEIQMSGIASGEFCVRILCSATEQWPVPILEDEDFFFTFPLMGLGLSSRTS